MFPSKIFRDATFLCQEPFFSPFFSPSSLMAALNTPISSNSFSIMVVCGRTLEKHRICTGLSTSAPSRMNS